MSRHVLFVAAVAAGCSFDATSGVQGGVEPGEALCAWSVQRSIVFDNATRSEDLIDVPVLVTLDSDFDYARAAADGLDVRFVDADGSPLAHEIERWDPGGTSLIWVRVPRIDALSSADSIAMLYDGPSGAEFHDPSAVWNDDYRGVWHGNAESGRMVDSTGHGHDGAIAGATVGPARLGDGMLFAGDGYVEVADSARLRVTDVTLEAWVRLDAFIPSGYVTFIEHARQTENWYGLWKTTRGDIFMLLWGNADFVDFQQRVNPDTWYYIAGTIDVAGGRAVTYIDGAVDANKGVSVVPNPTAGVLRFGATSIDTEFLDGALDEVRISAGARSIDWLSAQHASMTGSLLSLGAEQPVCP